MTSEQPAKRRQLSGKEREAERLVGWEGAVEGNVGQPEGSEATVDGVTGQVEETPGHSEVQRSSEAGCLLSDRNGPDSGDI